jgi:hypothetical protein
MRTQFEFEIVCECGALLEASDQQESIGGNCAFNSKIKFTIQPCASCIRKAKAPAVLIQQAMKALEEIT